MVSFSFWWWGGGGRLRSDKERSKPFDMGRPGLEQGSLLDRFKHVSAWRENTEDRWRVPRARSDL